MHTTPEPTFYWRTLIEIDLSQGVPHWLDVRHGGLLVNGEQIARPVDLIDRLHYAGFAYRVAGKIRDHAESFASRVKSAEAYIIRADAREELELCRNLLHSLRAVEVA